MNADGPTCTRVDDDILTAITEHLHPLVAVAICWAARKAALGARSCRSVYELKLALAIDRCRCVGERAAFVNLAIQNGVCCRLHYGPPLQPHGSGDAYGPSQLATLRGWKYGAVAPEWAHVVTKEIIACETGVAGTRRPRT